MILLDYYSPVTKLLYEFLMELDEVKIKILHYIKKRFDKNIETVKARLQIPMSGKAYTMSKLKPHLKELKKEDAIIDFGRTITITEKGIELLFKYNDLIKKRFHKTGFILNKEKDKQFFDYVKNTLVQGDRELLRPKYLEKKLGITNQTISHRYNRLKKLGYIDYPPRKPSELVILKDIED